MKPPHNRLLFIFCGIMVLVFIYYSSWKLRLVWGLKPQRDAAETTVGLTTGADVKRITESDAAETTVCLTKGAEVKRITELGTDIPVGRIVGQVYDEQGFLLKLDKKLPPEWVNKYGNLSEGVCKPGYAAAKMTDIYPKFMNPAPMFLDRNFFKTPSKLLSKVSKYLPPFGFRTQERIIDNILSATKNYGLGAALDSLSCKRCIILGNGGVLLNKSLGPRIDDYDVVVRLNEAPVSGYVKDVGTKTTIRITYPEGAMQKPEKYDKDSLFVLSAFKPLDFKWLKQMVFKEKLRGTEGFWKSVARNVLQEPNEIRILNPYFIQEAAFQFIGLPSNNGLMGKGNIPTLGTVAITMALHNCDEVAVAGFSYNMNTPNALLHYYNKTVKMSAVKESWTHNIAKEKEFLRKLVKANVITDLTNGI